MEVKKTSLGYIESTDPPIDIAKLNTDNFDEHQKAIKFQNKESQISTEAFDMESAFKNMINIEKDSVPRSGTILTRKSAKEKVLEFKSSLKEIQDRLSMKSEIAKTIENSKNSKNAAQDLSRVYSIHKELSLMKSTNLDNLRLDDKTRLSGNGVFGNEVLSQKLQDYTKSEAHKGKKKVVLEIDLNSNEAQHKELLSKQQKIEKLLSEIEKTVGTKSLNSMPNFLTDELDISGCCDKMEQHLATLVKDENFGSLESTSKVIKDKFKKYGDEIFQKHQGDEKNIDSAMLEQAHELYNHARDSDKFKGIIGEVVKFYEGVEKCNKEFTSFGDEVNHFKTQSVELEKFVETGVEDVNKVKDLMVQSFTDIEAKMLKLEERLQKL